jgi:hypothetical protein
LTSTQNSHGSAVHRLYTSDAQCHAVPRDYQNFLASISGNILCMAYHCARYPNIRRSGRYRARLPYRIKGGISAHNSYSPPSFCRASRQKPRYFLVMRKRTFSALGADREHGPLNVLLPAARPAILKWRRDNRRGSAKSSGRPRGRGGHGHGGGGGGGGEAWAGPGRGPFPPNGTFGWTLCHPKVPSGGNRARAM